MITYTIILGTTITMGLAEDIIFLLAAAMLGFSIHFYWSGRKKARSLSKQMPDGTTISISPDDEWRLQFYEQIEKHELNQRKLESELSRMNEAEKLLTRDLDAYRDEVTRLEKLVAKSSAETSTQPSKHMSELVMAQQNLNDYLSREMSERLEKAYEEFNFVQDRIEKIQSQVIEKQTAGLAYEELQQSYLMLSREYEELKLKYFNLLEESQRVTRTLADTEEKWREATFHNQQWEKKVLFLEELTKDLQDLSGHNKRLEGQLKRIKDIEALLSKSSEEGRK